MEITTQIAGREWRFDLNKPIDLSIPLSDSSTLNCFWAPPFRHEAVVMGSFVGDTQKGGAVNFKNVFLNPHGNGTHTECIAHICNIQVTINQTLQQFNHLAYLGSVFPRVLDNGDRVVDAEMLRPMLEEAKNIGAEAFVLRTLPNYPEKKIVNYSGSNPIYLTADAGKVLADFDVKHFLVDLPSLDREEDGGLVAAHKAFWDYPDKPRLDATITELIFVPDHVKDGSYLLQMQLAAFEMDAAPSKPILYKPI